MHTCIHAYMHTCIHAYMHAYIHTDRQTDRQTYIHTCIYIHMIYIYICACTHIFYIYISIGYSYGGWWFQSPLAGLRLPEFKHGGCRTCGGQYLKSLCELGNWSELRTLFKRSRQIRWIWMDMDGYGMIWRKKST